MADRRSGRRYPLQLRVDWHAAGDDPKAERGGRTGDISATGIYVVGDKPAVEEGSPVEVSVQLPVGSGGGPVDVRGTGRVVRVDASGGDRVGVAVSFDRIEFLLDELESFT